MNVYTVKNCKNCPYTKCVMKVDYDFDICPVEKKKREGYVNA